MNTIVIAPEVLEFVASVRAHLADLEPDELREMTDGLEADLTELVADQGVTALGDPVAYAAELRTAAGWGPAGARIRTSQPFAARVTQVVDAGRGAWDRLVRALPGDVEGFLDAVRPVWWVFRAWVAVQAALLWSSGWVLSVVPDASVPGGAITVVLMVLSVQLGRGRLWPRSRWRSAVGWRVLLITINALAVVMTPIAVAGIVHGHNRMLERSHGASTMPYLDPHGLSFEGDPVRNIYPYDAQGHPLTGIQLIDSDGHRLSLSNDPYDDGSGWGDFRLIPWLTGHTELLSVFPLPEQKIDAATGEPSGDVALQVPPFATLPPVLRPGIRPSVLRPAKSAH